MPRSVFLHKDPFLLYHMVVIFFSLLARSSVWRPQGISPLLEGQKVPMRVGCLPGPAEGTLPFQTPPLPLQAQVSGGKRRAFQSFLTCVVSPAGEFEF